MQNERHLKFTCAVAAVAVNQTFNLYRTKIGERVRWLSWKTLVTAAGGSTATWSIGDTAVTTRYVNAVTAVQTVGKILDGTAGFLYGVIDTVQVAYTAGAGAGATAPSIEVLIEVQQVWPTTS